MCLLAGACGPAECGSHPVEDLVVVVGLVVDRALFAAGPVAAGCSDNLLCCWSFGRGVTTDSLGDSLVGLVCRNSAVALVLLADNPYPQSPGSCLVAVSGASSSRLSAPW